MKIVWIKGGLGNQMFQYAFFEAMKKKYENVKLDTSSIINYKKHNGFELTNIFNIKYDECSIKEVERLSRVDYKFLSRVLRKLNIKKKTEYFEKEHMIFDGGVFNHNEEEKYYIGYWQNEKYFIDIRDELIKKFKFPDLNIKNKKVNDDIKNNDSVSLHVRRGDYLNNSFYLDINKENYYKKAIKYIIGKVENPKFFVFSDDIKWAKEEFKTYCGSLDFIYIDWNNGVNSYIDMQLMAACKYNIIANSSFSWWGAWLNNNPNKIVIAPKKWTINDSELQEIKLPKEWIKI